MTHGRKKPRQPRTLRNPIEHALFGATKLMECEIKSTLAPALECETRLREGVATDDQHTVPYTILLVAQGIEDSRIVRGLREQIASALQAMDAIRARATASGAWCPTALYSYELAAIREANRSHRQHRRRSAAAHPSKPWPCGRMK